MRALANGYSPAQRLAEAAGLDGVRPASGPELDELSATLPLNETVTISEGAPEDAMVM